MTAPLRIFIGLDPRQVIAYTTCAASIMARASVPVAITPLDIKTLPIERQGLTPFSFTRFLVPWLCDFDGLALYIDADTLFTADPAELFALAEAGGHAVWVRDVEGYAFERAAVMLFDCGHIHNKGVLTPEHIDDEAACRAPHLIDWTDRVGELGPDWHHLVGYDIPNPNAKLVHFTQGVPAWPETFACEWSEEWLRDTQVAVWPWATTEIESRVPWDALFGDSVHAKTLEDGRVVPKLYEPEVATAEDAAE